MRKWIALAAVAGLLMIMACNVVDTTAPTVSIVFPASGATVNKGDIVVKAVATDNKAVTKVEFYVDGTLFGTANVSSTSDTFQQTWSDTAAQIVGQNFGLVAKAYDAAGNATSSSSITITIAGGGGGSGPTHHQGEIPANETWYPSGNPHILDGDVWTGDNVTLTIMPGCVVEVSSGTELYCGYANPGSIIAVGKADSMITFTSLSDTAAGFWKDISFEALTMSTAKMSYCNVLFAGRVADDAGAVLVHDIALPFDHNVVRKSGTNGVWTSSAGYFSSFTNNTITGCTKYAVHIDAANVPTLGAGNTLTGNTGNGIEVHGSEVKNDGTWLDQGVPYVVTGDVNVDNNATLTIAAGTTVAFDADVEFYCGYSGPGSIIAVGTAASPITFTSAGDTTAGFWRDISFEGATMSTAKLSYCNVLFAGRISDDAGAVQVHDVAVQLDHDVIRKSGTNGVWLTSDGYFSVFTNNTVTGCANYPIHIDAKHVPAIGTGNALTGNTKDAIEVDGATIAHNGTWLNEGVPYVITSDVSIGDAANNPVVTIAAGTTIVLNSQVEFYCGYNGPGGLICDGTGGQITFTSSVTSPGFWKRLSFYSSSISSQCQLKNCKLSYGGHDDYGDIYIQDCTPTVTGCDIGYSSAYGIYLDGTTYPDPAALRANNTFHDNASGDVYVPPTK